MANIIRNKEYRVFSKAGCAQFKLRKLVDDLGEGKSTENYFVFLEAANIIPGKQAYDWENTKVTIRLGLTDIAILLNGFRNGFKGEKKYEIYHDPGKGSAAEGQEVKILGIEAGKEYGYFLSVRYTKKSPEKKVNIRIALTDEHMVILKLLFERSVIMLTGFFDE